MIMSGNKRKNYGRKAVCSLSSCRFTLLFFELHSSAHSERIIIFSFYFKVGAFITSGIKDYHVFRKIRPEIDLYPQSVA